MPIIRKRAYRCENCTQTGYFPWGSSYPEKRKCPRCDGWMRIIGYFDQSQSLAAQAPLIVKPDEWDEHTDPKIHEPLKPHHTRKYFPSA